MYKAVVPDKCLLPPQKSSRALFSKLSLKQGYLQQPLHLQQKPHSIYIRNYTYMPFSLSSAPNCSQKVVVSALTGILGASIYPEDFVVHGPTTGIHNGRLICVFAAFAKYMPMPDAEDAAEEGASRRICELLPVSRPLDFTQIRRGRSSGRPCAQLSCSAHLLPEHGSLLPIVPSSVLPCYSPTAPAAAIGRALCVVSGML